MAPERLAKTVLRLKERLKERMNSPLSNDGNEAIRQALQTLGVSIPVKSTEKIRWIQASVGDRIEFIDVAEVLFFQSADKYTRVVRRRGEALIRKPIYELVLELDEHLFWQIHRGTIVKVDEISDLERDGRGHLILRVKDWHEALEVSRTFSHRFRQM